MQRFAVASRWLLRCRRWWKCCCCRSSFDMHAKVRKTGSQIMHGIHSKHQRHQIININSHFGVWWLVADREETNFCPLSNRLAGRWSKNGMVCETCMPNTMSMCVCSIESRIVAATEQQQPPRRRRLSAAAISFALTPCYLHNLRTPKQWRQFKIESVASSETKQIKWCSDLFIIHGNGVLLWSFE